MISKAEKVQLAVVEVKIDGIKSDMAANQIVMKAHIEADVVAFREVLAQIDVLKAFRWQFYGAMIIISTLLGAVTWLRLMGIIP